MKINIISTNETPKEYIKIIEKYAKVININYDDGEFHEEYIVTIEIQNDINILFELYDDMKKYNKNSIFEGLLLHKNNDENNDEYFIELYDGYRE
jgi:thiamine pyrophosphate-dependent acetolactate synthase large subunit-like protein